ncbi:lysostaphin resistance A-like protein [Mucilaginibacter sp.]|uniref:CPBP family intramembrane glutamic endopeptidase n=1 Tax=Mucilaginibacter sp. TaxID=1882438 RepID=UPI003D0ACC9F
MTDKPYKDLQNGYNQTHPALQFLIFAGVFAGFFFVANLLGIAAIFALYGAKTLMSIGSLDTTAPHFVTALWILQTVGTTFPIFAAPVFFAYVIARDPQDYIKPSFRFDWKLIVVIFVIMFASMPLIEYLSNINQKLMLPKSLSGLQKWIVDSEASAQKLMVVMLKMNGIADMIFDVLFIGLLTAIVEEFMFRGVLQTIFVRWTKNTHAAVWITAILFSAFHMEFLGFLPRLLLGAFFGYFVAWSGSIWTGVLAHFINNATDVIATYLIQHKVINIDPNNQHVFNYAGYLLSLLIVILLLFIYKKITARKEQSLQY